MRPLFQFTFLFLSGLTFCSCNNSKKFDQIWYKQFDELGTSSSPKCADLNNDGVLDIVIGAAKNEYEKSDSAVIAFDGRTGEILWQNFAHDQIVGSAIFMDITNDSIPEVFIGGRSSEFLCIDGENGNTIWRYKISDRDSIKACCLRFNFFNAQIIQDVDNDGFQDLLISNGGNPRAKPKSRELRVPGVLAVFSSKTGAVISSALMPDGNETYMTPVIHDFEGKYNSEIIFGTGGETLGGNLFRVSLKDLLTGDISKAKVLASEEGRGFIAPPTITDVNNDGTADIIVNWFGGKLMALDGKTNLIIWQRLIPGTETYNTACPGFFNNDDIPDFFSTYNKGTWPDNQGSVEMMFDGKNGNIIHSDSLGCIGYSSGVTVDINEDGFDEVIFSVNDFQCKVPAFVGSDLLNDKQILYLFDFHNDKLVPIVKPAVSKNVSSTPWIGDIDGDQLLDIIYCAQRNHIKADQFTGFGISRIESDFKVGKLPTWSSYLGDKSDGILSFPRARKK
jgi:outer membrane protein assembly factor BamB